MEEPEINRMSMVEYRRWSEENWHGTDAEISARAGKLYDRLTEGLHLQVVSSSASSVAAHIMMIANEARKFPGSIDHTYHYQRIHLPHATQQSLTTIISIEKLNSQFAMILADIVANLI
jgi:hypothetical protein